MYRLLSLHYCPQPAEVLPEDFSKPLQDVVVSGVETGLWIVTATMN